MWIGYTHFWHLSVHELVFDIAVRLKGAQNDSFDLHLVEVQLCVIDYYSLSLI